MVDSRIIAYRKAAEAFRRGTFPADIPTSPQDELGLLGEQLRELGRTMERHFKHLQSLASLTSKVNSGFLLEEILESVYESFRGLIPYDRLGFALIVNNGANVCARWARSEATEVKLLAGYQAPLAGSSLQQIIDSAKPRILNDLEAYLKEHPHSESTKLVVEEGVLSSLTCPLIALGKPIGFIFFSSKSKNAFSEAHIELFTLIAGELAVIVEKSRLYEELLLLNKQKNKFLGIAAHDLRSPINVIKHSIEILLGNYVGELNAQQREILQRLDRVSENMLNLVNDLLDVSAIESGQLKLILQPVELVSFLREIEHNHQCLARPKQINLSLRLPEALPIVMLDPVRINQVFFNLISNAIKFSFPKSSITISCEAQEETVLFSISDQGQGIPQEEQSKLFEDFSKTSVRPTGGEKSTGLGLAIVKRIVEAHGGQITVESLVGEGSIFYVKLPISGPNN